MTVDIPAVQLTRKELETLVEIARELNTTVPDLVAKALIEMVESHKKIGRHEG